MCVALSSGARLDIIEAIDSTSREARRRALYGEPGPLWIVARHQTDGYGRNGAGWRQSPGDLAATLLFDPGLPPEAFPLLSFAAGLGLIDAIDAFVDAAARGGLSMKWPNDILSGDAKLSGLLIESIDGPGGKRLVALGVGVNILTAPALADYATARLADLTTRPPEPEDLLAAFDARLHERLSTLRTSGFESLCGAWLSRAYGVGRRCTIMIGDHARAGRFSGLAPNGSLLLETDDGTISIAAGTLRFAP